jgi:hypothetical protein
VFPLDLMSAWLLSGTARFRDRRGVPERGDVPGWVMVTVMSAILVVAIIGVFKGQITTAITHAIDSVSNSGGGN